MKPVFFSLLMLLLCAAAPPRKLTGRWETKISPKGNITGVVFYRDNTYEVYTNKKPLVSGKYKLRRNILTIEEPGCNGAVGIYKLVFFSHSDSLRFEPVSDTCSRRREGMSRTILGRIKKK